jgi:hypothetical protein
MDMVVNCILQYKIYIRLTYCNTIQERVMNRWEQIARQLLLNKKIVDVRYLTKEEAEDLGWDERVVAFQTEDGLWFFPSRDDEGNGGGALFTSDDKESCLPVM